MQRSTSKAAALHRRDLKLCALAVGIMAVFACVHLVALDVSWLRRIELVALDLQVRLRGPQSPGPEAVIVMIDDAAVRELGRWPVPRRKLAELVTLLRRADARVIAIDLLLADVERAGGQGRRDSDGDAALSKAIDEAGNVVLPFAFEFGEQRGNVQKPDLAWAAYRTLHENPGYVPLALVPTGIILPLEPLSAKATLGHVLVAYDIDGAPRYEYPALQYDLDYYPSMAVRVAQRFLGVPWSEVVVELGRGISLGPVFVPTDGQMRMLVNYLGGPQVFPTYPLLQVLSGAIPDTTFKNRIVLVGTNAIGTRDTFVSPFTAVMPGVERLATIADSIVQNRHLRRTQSSPWLEVALMLGAAVVLGVTTSRLSLAVAALCALALTVLMAGSAQIALARGGQWQASAVPILATIATFIALSLFRYGLLDKERRHIRNVFKQYLAPQMVDRVIANPKLPELGGELREITIMFCDLRGFTALSERLDPATLTQVANTFLSAATEVVLEHGGTVDKYLGDAIMAFWNAPVDQPNHAELACRAALRILDRVGAINESMARSNDLPHLAVGVGINTGRCTVGNFGSRQRFDYSAIGDPVNVAARLEGETKSLGIPILIGPETAAGVTKFATRFVDQVRLRGRKEMVHVYTLVGDERVDSSESSPTSDTK